MNGPGTSPPPPPSSTSIGACSCSWQWNGTQWVTSDHCPAPAANQQPLVPDEPPAYSPKPGPIVTPCKIGSGGGGNGEGTSEIENLDEVADHSGALSESRILESDERTITLSSVLRSERPGVPATCDWRPNVHRDCVLRGLYHKSKDGHTHYQWGKMLNKELRDCTVAAAGHMIQTWTANAEDSEITIPDEQVFEAYCRLTGYNPDETPPENSPASSCLAALRFWRHVGIGDHRIHSFVRLSQGDRAELQETVYMLGSAYVGLLLPNSAKKQGIWDVVTNDQSKATEDDSDLWMAHAVNVVAYTEEEVTVISWGFEKRMTWAFYEKYADEAYGVLSREWIQSDGKAPNHIELESLEAQLDALQ